MKDIVEVVTKIGPDINNKTTEILRSSVLLRNICCSSNFSHVFIKLKHGVMIVAAESNGTLEFFGHVFIHLQSYKMMYLTS